ncbi:MAG: radical SAM protein [Negativicutes bacterium]|nr:radical SAM protein [Negativicutes bacterium]
MSDLDKLKRRESQWEEGRAKTVTFIVTEDCQLRCKYCYLVGKNPGRRIEFDVAKRTVEYLLQERSLFDEPSIIWDFIGGEPFLEIDLIDKISDYIKFRMYETGHPWFDSYRFSFSTNGLMYDDPRVQRYIEKIIPILALGSPLTAPRKSMT